MNLHALKKLVVGSPLATAQARHERLSKTAALAVFAFLIALSRVVLGLHYPTDVAAGALLGGALAMVSLALGGMLGA